ncbi:MAG: alpha-L-fucosidase, partial [Schaalia georgiae]|nr:alpha-L-fucosidase [Schaalia georgiae]
MKLTRTLVGVSVAAALSLTGLGHAALADPPPATDSGTQSAATAAGTATGIPLAVPLSATQKVADWQSLQFGLFMHWGVYSTYEGMYQGRPQRMGYPEQIKAWEKIPDSDYKAQAATMTADKWDAANVCQTAKNTGMKYVMITTKHHDGFAMWDTKTTDYNVV